MPKHPLQWSKDKGLLADALGIPKDDPQLLEIETTVVEAINNKWNMKKLFDTVSDMDISDEMWANFLYTYGWWDGRRRP